MEEFSEDVCRYLGARGFSVHESRSAEVQEVAKCSSDEHIAVSGSFVSNRVHAGTSSICGQCSERTCGGASSSEIVVRALLNSGKPFFGEEVCEWGKIVGGKSEQ